MLGAEQLKKTLRFPHLVCDHFLPEPLLSKISRRLHEPLPIEQHPAGYSFAALMDEELIRYIYRFVRNRVGPYFNQQYSFSPIYKLPQVYKIQGPWPGLAPHTDNQVGRDLAMIVYMSWGWRPEFGGELNLLNSEGEPFKVVKPLFNRAVFFPLGEKSLHSVSPLHTEWERVTIIQDFAMESR